MTLRRFPIDAVCLAVLLAAAAVPGAQAGDAARARAGVEAGRYVPLASILDWLDARYHGRVIEVELEEEEGDEPPTYEVEWLTPQGRVVEFEFDARSGELLEREGRGLEEAAR